jgi:omega-6 fatty acid desaturase (delta-12 desaturase)
MSAAAALPVSSGPAPWKELIRPYAKPRLVRSWIDVATSVVPYVALTAGMYVLIHVSLLLTLALAPLTAGFLLRTFILFHDCTHGSLWPTKRANAWWGRVLGLLLFMPFAGGSSTGSIATPP